MDVYTQDREIQMVATHATRLRNSYQSITLSSYGFAAEWITKDAIMTRAPRNHACSGMSAKKRKLDMTKTFLASSISSLRCGTQCDRVMQAAHRHDDGNTISQDRDMSVLAAPAARTRNVVYY